MPRDNAIAADITRVGPALSQSKLPGVIILNPYKKINEKSGSDKAYYPLIKIIPDPGQVGHIACGKLFVEGKDQHGTCVTLTAATLHLLKLNGCIESNGSTEVFSINFGPGTDHVFIVMARDPQSKITDPDTWGDDCYVIDQWYANQKLTAPGNNPIKDKTTDATYWKLLRDFKLNRRAVYTEEVKHKKKKWVV